VVKGNKEASKILSLLSKQSKSGSVDTSKASHGLIENLDKNNFFETDESEYSDAEDSDILDYPRIFKTHQEPEYDEDESEDASILSNALKTVQSMRETRNKGNLGMFSKYDPSPEARKDRGYYQRMGKSLIQLMSPLTIRNEKEFNEMIQGLYDPDITDAEAEGVLNAAEDLIKQNLDIERSKGKKGSKGKKESKTTKKSTETKEEGIPKPPVTSFFK
jgi:hypothetical protein